MSPNLGRVPVIPEVAGSTPAADFASYPLALQCSTGLQASSTYTFGSVLATTRLQLLQVWRLFHCALLGTRGTNPGLGSVVVTD